MRIRIWTALGLLAVGITWLYDVRILAPWENYVEAENGNLRTAIGDLYSPWMGARELLLHHRNPYGADVSHEIQKAFYGHEIRQDYGPGESVLDEQRFAYPVYVVFLLAPTISCDFHTLQLWAAPFFALLTTASLLIWIDLSGWRPPKALVAAMALFVLSSPQIVQGLRLLQLGLIVSFLLAVGAWCISRNHLAIAGIFFALSTIKPHMILFPLLWFLLWGLSAVHKRWRLIAGFAVTLATLIVLGVVILPQWLSLFLAGLVAYRKYRSGMPWVLRAAKSAALRMTRCS
jgi:hypothetical protein